MRHTKQVILLTLLFLAGCASSNQLSYRPRGSNDMWSINVVKSGYNVIVTVNDSTAINESLGVFQRTADFRGAYLSHVVLLHMEYVSQIVTSYWSCDVSIDGEMAGRFKI